MTTGLLVSLVESIFFAPVLYIRCYHRKSIGSEMILNKKLNSEPSFPTSRIRTIMKSSIEAGQITNEVLFLMAKATEMFVRQVTQESFQKANPATNSLKYEHLAQYVQDEDRLEFLLQIVPLKIKVHEFQELLQQNDDSDSSSSE